MPFDRQGGELAVQRARPAPRHARSVLITTNLAVAEWPRVFGGDEKLTTALLDRLAEHATVITTKGKSYRMRKRGTTTDAPAQAVQAQAADAPSTPRPKEGQKEVKLATTEHRERISFTPPNWISFTPPRTAARQAGIPDAYTAQIP